MMWLMFLLGALAGVIVIISIGMYGAMKEESIKRKEKRNIQAKTDTVASVLYKASWSLGYIQGKYDAKAGIDELPDTAYKRIKEEEEA